MEIIFDTYAWIEYFGGTKKGEVVQKYLEESEVYTPWIVLLELSYKANKEGWNFESILKFIRLRSKVIGIDEDFILSFGKIYNDVKKEIKGIGMADIIVLNSVKFLKAKVLTGDPHFKIFEEAVLL